MLGKPLDHTLLALAIWFGQVRRGEHVFTPEGSEAFETAILKAATDARKLGRAFEAGEVCGRDADLVAATQHAVALGDVRVMPTALTLQVLGIEQPDEVAFGEGAP